LFLYILIQYTYQTRLIYTLISLFIHW